MYFTAQPLGAGRWTYAYELDRFSYPAGYGFTVYFDPALYGALALASPGPGADWDPIVAQPDAGLGADGLYDAEALFDDADRRAVFRVSFDWLGTGEPGAQPFELREPGPSYAVVESGTTHAPEPTDLAPHAAWIALAALVARTRSRC